MIPTMYIFMWFPIVIFLYLQYKRNQFVIIKNITQKRTKKESGKGDFQMIELAKQFIGKECIIYIFSTQVIGVVKEVAEGAILLQRDDSVEAINIDFISRIREYPLDKKGKRKSFLSI